MTRAVVAGALAGILLGWVLQRGRLCFHSAIAGSLRGRHDLARAWALGVALGSVGLAVLFLLPGTGGLDHGLAFRPVANIAGGLLIGVGMVVASSCVSGLFHKLGSGMLGALAGLAGWGAGELAARRLRLPGPALLPGGDGATLAGVLGLPRLLVALAVLALVLLTLRRSLTRAAFASASRDGGWPWPRLGLGLGAALTAGWALAAAGGASFGPSTVGAVAGIAAGAPNGFLVAFLLGLVAGALLSARRAGEVHVRGERPRRYVGLAAGGFLLGAGGWVAGGCNLGHGLSGLAQLNVSSAVVVAAMITGVLAASTVARRLDRRPEPAGAR